MIGIQKLQACLLFMGTARVATELPVAAWPNKGLTNGVNTFLRIPVKYNGVHGFI